MELINYIFARSFHIYLLIAALLFSAVWPKRDRFCLRCGLILGSYVLLPFFGLYDIPWLSVFGLNLVYVVLFFGLLLALWGCFKLSFIELIFFGIASYAVQHAADCFGRVTSILIAPLFGIDMNNLNPAQDLNKLWYIFNVGQIICATLVYFASYMIFAKRLIKEEKIRIEKNRS